MLAFVAVAAIATNMALAAPSPLTPNTVTAGTTAKMCWTADASGTWDSATVSLMTGDNWNMQKLVDLEICLDMTVAGCFDWTVPQVTQYTSQFFFQASFEDQDAWSTRFAIASPAGVTSANPFPTQSNGDKISWGNAVLVATSSSATSSVAVSSSASQTASSATATSGSSTSQVSSSSSSAKSSSASQIASSSSAQTSSLASSLSSVSSGAANSAGSASASSSSTQAASMSKVSGPSRSNSLSSVASVSGSASKSALPSRAVNSSGASTIAASFIGLLLAMVVVA